MGLDMYLERCDRRAYGFKDMDIDEIRVSNPALYEVVKPYIHKRGNERYSWESLFEEVGYWRKANAIHKWFVENVQDDVDDCGRYEVSKEQLETLLSTCEQVLASCKLVKGKVKNGYTFDENGNKIPIFEDGEYIADPTIAEELLPTQSGFFFGGTDYDEWYLEDIKYTIDLLKDVLATTDFDKEMVVYTSSW